LSLLSFKDKQTHKDTIFLFKIPSILPHEFDTKRSLSIVVTRVHYHRCFFSVSALFLEENIYLCRLK
jgi:hypothetical protein